MYLICRITISLIDADVVRKTHPEDEISTRETRSVAANQNDCREALATVAPLVGQAWVKFATRTACSTVDTGQKPTENHRGLRQPKNHPRVTKLQQQLPPLDTKTYVN